MKTISSIFLLLMAPFMTLAQYDQNFIDSMQTALEKAANDTVRMEINRQLGFYFQDSNPDISLVYHQEQLNLAKKLNLKLWEADAYQQVGYCYQWIDNLPASYESYMNALKIAKDSSSSENAWGYHNFSFSSSPDDARQSIVGMIHYEMANLYRRSRSYDEVRSHMFQALRIGEKLQNKKILSLSTRDMGKFYFETNQPDSAFKYYKMALQYYKGSSYQIDTGFIYQMISDYYNNKQNYDSAMIYTKKAIVRAILENKPAPLSSSQIKLGFQFQQIDQLDSAIFYTQKGIETAESINTAKSINSLRNLADGRIQLASIYKQHGNYSLAYDLLESGKALMDSINDEYITRLVQFQKLDFDQKIRLQELEKENELTKSRIRTFALLAGLGIFLLIALFLYRNNRLKQKANKVLEATLANLKTTQAQLIQSEKMASLGELTAGIAHEIQNPLNFVNNFSELNQELVEEASEELKKGDYEETAAILKDLGENSEKITHHGKRADAIIKGMLAHSRSGKGEKEPTDLNALAEEYLKLSYHGLRAKDKNFNADFKTDFDPNLPKVNVVPQDIGRVLLNLINNAFQAVSERSKKGEPGYQPEVSVETQLKTNNQIRITIRDNGPGIPDSIKEKIFQPFFTTKPTGQGTGLGLSLSYDIVKAHGGTITVKSTENKGLPAGEAGTEFTIQLPI